MTARAPRRPASSTPATSGKLRPLLLSFAVAGVAAGIGGWWYVLRAPTPQIIEPAQPDLKQSPRPVAAIIQQYREEVLSRPTSGSAWGNLGMVYFAHQFEAEAAECFEQAQAWAPQEWRWPHLMGLLVGVSDVERAEREYRRALELNPKIPTAKTRLGELVLAAERYDEAAELFADALRLDDRDVKARLGLARVKLQRGDLAGAIELAEQAAEQEPEARDAYALLAQLHHRAGHAEAARRAQEAAVKYDQNPLSWDDPLAAEVLQFRRDLAANVAEAKQLADSGQVDRAVSLLSGAIQDDERSPDAFADLGHYLIQLGRLDEARSILDQGLRRFPSTAELHFKQGVVASLRRQPAAAEPHYRAALALNPRHALALFNLGLTLQSQEKNDEALESFLRAAEVRPEYADAHFQAAKQLIRQGKKQEAAQHLETVLKIRPDDSNARRLLATLR